MEENKEEYKGCRKVEIYCNGEKNNAIVLEWEAWKMWRGCSCWEELFRALVINFKEKRQTIWWYRINGEIAMVIPIYMLPKAIRELLEEKLGDRREREEWILFREDKKYREEVLSVQVEYRVAAPER